MTGKHFAPDVQIAPYGPMSRIEAQGELLRASRSRLRDPNAPRVTRWAGRVVLAMMLGPFVLAFVAMLITQLVSTFGR